MTEQELTVKYKSAGIVKGSLRKGRGKHASKNVVDVKCSKCGKKQTVATSDLWLKLCNGCDEKLNAPKRRQKGATNAK